MHVLPGCLTGARLLIVRCVTALRQAAAWPATPRTSATARGSWRSATRGCPSAGAGEASERTTAAALSPSSRGCVHSYPQIASICTICLWPPSCAGASSTPTSSTAARLGVASRLSSTTGIQGQEAALPRRQDASCCLAHRCSPCAATCWALARERRRAARRAHGPAVGEELDDKKWWASDGG